MTEIFHGDGSRVSAASLIAAVRHNQVAAGVAPATPAPAVNTPAPPTTSPPAPVRTNPCAGAGTNNPPHNGTLREEFHRRKTEAQAKAQASASPIWWQGRAIPVQYAPLEPGVTYMAGSAFSCEYNNCTMFFEKNMVLDPERPELIQYLLHGGYDVVPAVEEAQRRAAYAEIDEDEDIQQCRNLYGERHPLYLAMRAEALGARGLS